MQRMLFLNLPVADLQRSIAFFEALGFAFNPQFTDATATCMLIGEDAYAMLLTPERLVGYSDHPLADPRSVVTGAHYALTVDSREDVDAMVERALTAGGQPAGAPQDHGFMYLRSFYDLDGHGWEVMWMDPGFVQS